MVDGEEDIFATMDLSPSESDNSDVEYLGSMEHDLEGRDRIPAALEQSVDCNLKYHLSDRETIPDDLIKTSTT